MTFTFKATYSDNRVRLTERFHADNLEQALSMARKYAATHNYRLVSVEEVA